MLGRAHTFTLYALRADFGLLVRWEGECHGARAKIRASSAFRGASSPRRTTTAPGPDREGRAAGAR
jgi:hypothetical protein